MIKKRLKLEYLLIFIGIFVILPLLLITTIIRTNLDDSPQENYTNEEIVHDSYPVIKETTRVIKPYTDQSVTIGKNYYDYKGKEEDQLKGIIKHDNTYIQNTGIDYVSEKEFEVISILDGTVVEVKEDETVGNTIEIKHNDGYISIYQSLNKVNVKKGDIITQGQVIGTSGTNELDKEIGNHLHFEIYNNGQSINPETYLEKEINVEKER